MVGLLHHYMLIHSLHRADMNWNRMNQEAENLCMCVGFTYFKFLCILYIEHNIFATSFMTIIMIMRVRVMESGTSNHRIFYSHPIITALSQSHFQFFRLMLLRVSH